jgi:hypothetical protein
MLNRLFCGNATFALVELLSVDEWLTELMVLLHLHWIIGAIYFLSRFYIVVESFISLRHVPIGVYETSNVTITNYIHHF